MRPICHGWRPAPTEYRAPAYSKEPTTVNAHGLTLSATDVRMSGLKAHMPFDLVGSKIMTVYPVARHLGRRWLDELLADANANAESIAKRERCSIRKVNMTISLAFLAPDLVKAAIAGRLPHGMGVARLADMPAEWSRQHQMLGLPSA